MTSESPVGLRTAPLVSREVVAAESGRWLAGGLLTMLALAALVLAWRRAAGALESPLPGPALPLVAAAAAAVAASVRGCWRFAAGGSPSTWIAPFFRWAPVAALGLLGGSLSLPGSSATGLAAFWLILAVEETWSLGEARRREIPRREPPPEEPRAVVPAAEHVRFDRPQTEPAGPVSMLFGTEEIAPEDVVQQLTRSHSADGGEVLSGWLRVELAPGQRSANLHVAFCPPFARTPTLAVEQYSGPAARIKTVQLLPYGTRLDLKLDQPSQEAAGVLLQFLARIAPDEGDSVRG